MFALNGRTDEQCLQAFLDELPAELVPLSLLYEHTDRDSLHVWLVSDAFSGLGEEERGDLVWPVFRHQHAGLVLRTSLIFKLTPAEFTEQFGHTLDDLPDTVQRLDRCA